MAIDYCYVSHNSEWESTSDRVEGCDVLSQLPPQHEIDDWVSRWDVEWFPEASSDREVKSPVENELNYESVSELDKEIERAKCILDGVVEGEDEEDFPIYTKAALARAIVFLRSQSDQFRKIGVSSVPVPKIGPGPNSSVDLHWRREGWELLVNIPSDSNRPATFYGDDYGVQKIKGSFDTTIPNRGLVIWLMKS
jgi:hypothetical protein